jgi:paraquat-inducible protein A
MAEIYMLGVFVTVIKVYHMAYIKYDAGFFCFAGLIISTVFASTSMDERFYWDSIEKLQTGNR